MSPRPRKVSDEEVFAATHRAMQRLGPGELTLSEIAAEAGVTAGALVQRFGSKRELLLKLSQAWAGSGDEFLQELARRHKSPLATLRAYAECLAELAPSPEALARNLAYLQIDVTDPEFRVHLLASSRATRTGLERLIAAAVAAGELRKITDPKALALTVESTLSGALLTWAIYREGKPERWLRERVEAVIKPYLRT
ncbi:MAG TPA: helix-turn-helix domain-containing protein [Gemmatimonadales bacterium]|nr:helix-turn-helix domain-containing protein [Gemmatimonadales bacterium]